MSLDAVVVGSGPNGLAAAITLARAGRSVTVLEANDTVGGALRSAELTEPGFVHDVGSAIHPFAVASPFLRSLPLAEHGLEWVTPPASAAHPVTSDESAIAWHDLDRTAAEMGADEAAYRRVFTPLVQDIDALIDLGLHPVLRVPPHPVTAARFAGRGWQSAERFARRTFTTERARALIAGHAAHTVLPLDRPFTAAFGLLFGATAHAAGWPFPRGGAQQLTDAMVSLLRASGGTIETGRRVDSIADVPSARVVILALTARQVLDVSGPDLSERYRRRLGRFRYGSATFKVDYALDGPIPWSDPAVASSATVHLGGTLAEVASSEAEVGAGRAPEHPFVLLAQPSLFDSSRAPTGKHTAWAYCHVPHGYEGDVSDRIEAQIERFAPGFGARVISRHVSGPRALETGNANLVGGDIGGGSMAGRQLLFRPVVSRHPWQTSEPSVLIGSSSATPGAGVHGMAGHQAATRALATVLR